MLNLFSQWHAIVKNCLLIVEVAEFSTQYRFLNSLLIKRVDVFLCKIHVMDCLKGTVAVFWLS